MAAAVDGGLHAQDQQSAACLQQPRRHTTLDFSNAYLGDGKCADIVNAVRRAAYPVQLDLRGNRFEAAGAKLLAEMLRTQHSVVSLCLEWNNVGLLDEGVVALAAALEVDARLLELDLRNNNIGPEGAKALALALRRNRTLRKLDLRWNEIGNAGVLALLDTLQSNHALLTLELTGNNSSLKHAEEIERLLARNRSIQGQAKPPEEPQNQLPSPSESSGHGDQLLMQVLSEKEALETDLNIAKRHNVKLTEKIEECEMQIQLLRKENDSAKQDRDRFQQREIDVKADAHDARMRLEELENRRRVEFEEYCAARAALERDCSALRDKLIHAESLYQKSDDHKTKQLAQLEALKYSLESEIHRLTLSAGTHQDELQKLRKELVDARKDHERKERTMAATHKSELAGVHRQHELNEAALQTQVSYTLEQLEDLKRSLSGSKEKHDAMQALLLQERVAHERQLHELKKQWETDSQERTQKSIQGVEAQVEELKKSRVFLEKEVEKHMDAVLRLRQENFALQQANDERIQGLQRERDRQYEELQAKQTALRDAQKEAATATEKLQQLHRRMAEQEQAMAHTTQSLEDRLTALKQSSDAATAHNRTAIRDKNAAIARLESQVLRVERAASEQSHAHELRFDKFADAVSTFVQDQVKRERERRQPRAPEHKSEEEEEEEEEGGNTLD